MYEFYTEKNLTKRKSKPISTKRSLVAIFVLGIFVLLFSFFLPPKDFPAGEIVVVEKGSSLEEIAEEFEEKGLIKSTGLFKTFVIASGGDKNISAGDYIFKNPMSTLGLARRLANSEFGVEKISVTLPEGLSIKEMSKILASKLSEFNPDEFIFLTQDMEGYLFPDTYLFFPTTKSPDVVRMLRDTFNRKIDSNLRTEINKTGKSLEEIIIMASIIQDEAFDGYEEKQMISGILWKRLEKGMRLQADATLRYVTGKTSKQLTRADLADDNPYNTYTREGLPPTPIGNPGLDAIKAAMYPKESPYLFYLHDNAGGVHYAENFDGHKKNIATYLR